MAEEKTEQATDKKKRDERKKGNIFQSSDVVAAASIFGIFYTLKIAFPFIYDYLSKFMSRYLTNVKEFTRLTTADAMMIFRDGAIAVVLVAGPVMLAAMAIGVLVAGIQTRFLFSYESMKLKFSRLSPLQGIKRLISLRSIVELIKSLLKTIIIAAVLWQSVQKILGSALRLISMDIMVSTVWTLDTIMGLVVELSAVFLAIACFDYFYQWWDHRKNLRMTKQEVKEEYKHTEGDPQIKGKIKEAQQKMAMKRMMQQVPTADVVIRNPTHFAVALKYDPDRNQAPIVVAKGQDELAFRIIAEAERCGIPITENRPLARALYAAVECDQEIPADFYEVMAEVMAWVFSLKQKKEKEEKR